MDILALSCGSCPIYDNVTDSCIFPSDVQYIIDCDSQNWKCEFSGTNFLLDSNSAIFMNGSCELALEFQTFVILETNTNILSSALYISAEYITLNHDSLIDTSNRGPFLGPGATILDNGFGGAYGGSGSERPCQTAYYSSTNNAIGSIDVAADVAYFRPLETTYASDFFINDPTFGSGGGSEDGPRGGGRIVLNASMLVNTSGILRANGGDASSSALNTGIGAGSGGSVTIISDTVIASTDASISAVGGNGYTNELTSAIVGGSGGGGRVMIQYMSLLGEVSVPHVDAYGGISFSTSGFSKSCGSGGAGTLYVVDLSQKYGVLYITNDDVTTLAVTLYDSEDERSPVMFREVDIIGDAIFAPNELLVDKTKGSINLFSGGMIVSVSGHADVTKLSCHDLSVVGGSISVQGLYADIATLFYMDSSSSLIFQTIANASVASGNFTVDGIIEYDGLQVQGTGATLQLAKLVVFAVSITFSATSSVNVGSLYLYSNESTIFEGDIDSFVDTCGSCFDASSWSCPQVSDIGSNFSIVVLVSDESDGQVIGNGHVHFKGNSAINGGSLIVCAPNINIEESVVVSSDGLGCSAEEGKGAGVDGLGSSGSGGGYGGNGGSSVAGDLGGVEYGGNDGKLYYGGSGGGMALGGASGGIMKIVAKNSFTLDGTLSSNGLNGISDSAGGGGGGSGGSIAILAGSMSSSSPNGKLTSYGGNGDDMYGAGGGGGGRIVLQLGSQGYSFVGTFDVSSGFGGSVGGFSGEGGTFYWPVCPVGSGNQMLVNDSVVDGSYVCQICPKGTYQSEPSSGSCLECSNKPKNSFYSQKGDVSSECQYKCDSGYSGSSCLSSMQKLINDLGGPGGFAGVMLGLVALVLILIFCISSVATSFNKLKRSYQQLEWTTFQNTNNVDSLLNKLGRYSEAVPVEAADKDNCASVLKQPLLENRGLPLYASLKTVKDSIGDVGQEYLEKDDDTVWAKIARRIHRFHEVEHHIDASDRFSCSIARKLMAVRENQLQRHIGRIYFLGRNCPIARQGGPWRLPLFPPPLMSSMVKHDAYEKFAHKVNKELGWPDYGWEVMIYYVLVAIFPPLSSLWLSNRRLARADILTILIYEYDQAMFVSKRAQDLRDSIRLGMSQDNTLAYLDFLFVDESLDVGPSQGVFLPHLKLCLPCNEVDRGSFSPKSSDKDRTISIIPKLVFGQPALPVAFKFAGLGSYHCPWNIEASDVLLQSIPHVAGLSRFIDRHWIECIVEINSKIRSMHKSSIEKDLPDFLSFLEALSSDQTGTKLGGLRVDCCLLSNTDEALLVVHPKDYLTEWCGSLDFKLLSSDKTFSELQHIRLRYSISCIFANPPVSVLKDRVDPSPSSKIFSPLSLYLIPHQQTVSVLRPVYSEDDMLLNDNDFEEKLSTLNERISQAPKKDNIREDIDNVISETLSTVESKPKIEDSYNPFGGRHRSRSNSSEGSSGINSLSGASSAPFGSVSKSRTESVGAGQTQEISQRYTELDSIYRICNAIREGFVEIGILIHVPTKETKSAVPEKQEEEKQTSKLIPVQERIPRRLSRRPKSGKKERGGKRTSVESPSMIVVDESADAAVGADKQSVDVNEQPRESGNVTQRGSNNSAVDVILRPSSLESTKSSSVFIAEANSALLQPIQVVRYCHFSQVIESKRNMQVSIWRLFKRSARMCFSALLQNHNQCISSPGYNPNPIHDSVIKTESVLSLSPESLADKISFDSGIDAERRRTRSINDDEAIGLDGQDEPLYGGSTEAMAWSVKIERARAFYFWILAVLLAADAALSVIMLDNLYCVSSTSEHGGSISQRRLTEGLHDSNGCDVTFFVLVMLLWPPCSIIISPIIGLAVLGVGKGNWIRIYASWNKLSIINAVVALFCCLGLFGVTDFAVLVALCVIFAKTITAVSVNRYIAMIERRRRNSGWSGLLDDEEIG